MDLTEVILESIETVNGELKWVPRTIKLDVEAAFKLDDNNLDAEICRMGQLLLEYGDLEAELKAQSARKKAAIDYVGSIIAGQIRDSGKKLTESAIKEQVVLSDDYQNSVFLFQDAEKDSNKITNHFRSLQKKADLLIALTYKQKAEIRNQ